LGGAIIRPQVALIAIFEAKIPSFESCFDSAKIPARPDSTQGPPGLLGKPDKIYVVIALSTLFRFARMYSRLKTYCLEPSQISSRSKSSSNRHHAQGFREAKRRRRTERRTGNRYLSCERRVRLLLNQCTGPDMIRPPVCPRRPVVHILTQDVQNHKTPVRGFNESKPPQHP